MSAAMTLCLSPYRSHHDPSPMMGGPVRVATWELAHRSKTLRYNQYSHMASLWAHLAWRVERVALEKD